ncbi:hypothetical protein M422DRAFT_26302 [Sphaerobolus stellatus SS14]|nr:hypothetical protein M422DRAFT_26302 [Sphaerobolus stellatus SS14]
MAKAPDLSLFKGNYNGDENPQAWLQRFTVTTFTAKYNDATSVSYFGMLMVEGEEAGDWWEEMQEKETGGKDNERD